MFSGKCPHLLIYPDKQICESSAAKIPRKNKQTNTKPKNTPALHASISIFGITGEHRPSALSDQRQDTGIFRRTTKIFCIDAKFDGGFRKGSFHFLAIEALVEVKREILKRLALGLFPRRSLP